MKKILITGGAGFIGSNFIHKINSETDFEIVVVDKLTYAGNKGNIKDVKHKFIHADINDIDKYKDELLSSNYVVHFAAESHVTRSEKSSDVFYATNVEGTKQLLTALLDSNSLEKVVHISTDEVYGDAKDGQFFKEEDKKPGDKQATSPYAKSKALADDTAQTFFNKLPLNILRPTNMFGPYQYPEKLFPRSATRIISGKPIELWGEGLQIRDWLYAPDNVNAVLKVLLSAPNNEIYNVSANNSPEIKNRDLAHWLLGRLHKYNAKINFIDDPREFHDFRYGLDSSKLRKLGWEPNANAWEQFEETVKWYIKNRSWWEESFKEAEELYK